MKGAQKVLDRRVAQALWHPSGRSIFVRVHATKERTSPLHFEQISTTQEQFGKTLRQLPSPSLSSLERALPMSARGERLAAQLSTGDVAAWDASTGALARSIRAEHTADGWFDGDPMALDRELLKVCG